MRFPPLKTLELFTMACGLFTVFHFNSAYEHLIFYFGLNNAPIFFSKYFLILLRGIFDVTLMQGFLCLIPRKLIVMNKHLVVKSISYYSYLIPLSEISSVSLKRPIQFSLEFWLKVKFRYYFYNLKFWQKGLLINLKDGRSYFFGVTSSKLALLELQGLLARDLSVEDITSETAHGSKQRIAS